MYTPNTSLKDGLRDWGQTVERGEGEYVGLLNQAEVVLAFGAVGQMFAGLSDNGATDSTQLATSATLPDKHLAKGLLFTLL